VGAVQKLATVVIIGLTGLATLLVFLLADEPGRRDEELTEQEDVAISRGITTYITNCLVCHGPAGEGNNEPGRAGVPIGGNTPQRLINQSEDPVIRAEREQQIRTRIHGGSPIGCSTVYPAAPCAMPPWGQDYGGELNDEQIEELVLMIQNVDWDLVYNEAIHASGGYPTAPVPADATEPPDDGQPQALRLEAYDIGWRTGDQNGPMVELTVAPGAVIDIVNAGAAAHNFDSPDLGLFLDLPPGAAGQVTIPADAAPGTYEFICSIPGHAAAGMVGTITVDPNAGGGAGGEPAPPEGSPEGGGTPVASPEGGGTAEASPAATPVGTPGPPPAEVRLEAWDIGWRLPDQPGPTVRFSIQAGGTLTIVNTGQQGHNFTAEALGLTADPLPGETVTLTIPPDTQPGDYEFICAVPGHATAGMVGTISVAPPEGGAATPGAATPGVASPEAATPAAGGEPVQLEAYDIGWRSADQAGPQVNLTVAPGTTIEIVSTGAAGHNFDAPDLDLFLDLPPGASGEVTIPADTPPGTYDFVCSIPGHAPAGMVGTITVQ
jgi:nitrite reductase (NO-forming)